MLTTRIRKLLYRWDLLTPFWKVDRVRYLKRLSKKINGDWRYVAPDDAMQIAGSDVVARMIGLTHPVFFYCDRNSSSIEAEILKTASKNVPQTSALKQRMRVLELGQDMIVPGSRVVDVGANIGIYSLPWAVVDPDVIVHSFEPHPGVRDRLKRNVNLNRLAGRIILHPEALSDHAGTATLYGNNDMSSLSDTVYGVAEAEPIKVQLACLDDVIAIDESPISLIKVDVQGHELEVLRGGRKIIDRHRPVLILEHEDSLFLSADEAGKRKADLGHLLAEMNYETLYISRWGSDLLSVVDWQRPLNGDLLALPMDRT
jgi:FkbM family methyltransferase